MKTIVVFKNGNFNKELDDFDVDSTGIPLGKELAEVIREKMMGRSLLPSVVIEATEGWEFEVNINREDYIFFVNWIPLGNPPENYWAVQTRKRRGLVKTILRGEKRGEDEIQEAIYILEKIIDDIGGIENVRWMDMDTFSKIY